MSYRSAFGKLMKATRFEELVIEAGLYASGSLDSVLTDRHYKRAMTIHAWMVEALERLLFTSFTQTSCSNQLITELTSEVKTLQTNVCHAKLDNFNLKGQVKRGKRSTAKFWFDYIFCQSSVTTRSNNFDMRVSSLQMLYPSCFA